MKCNHCGSELPDGAKFCTVCGTRSAGNPMVIQPVPPVETMTGELGWGKAQDLVDETPAGEPAWKDQHGSEPTTVLSEVNMGPHCPRCGNALYGGTNFCRSCGWSAAAPAPAAPGRPAPQNYGKPATYTADKKPGSGKLIGLIAGGAAALLLIIVLIVGFATDWFGLTGPALTIANATKNTLQAESFTANFDVSIDGESLEGTAYVDYDLQTKEINLYMEMELDGEDLELAIYDGYAIIHVNNYWRCVDVSDEVDDYYDTMDQTGAADPDWEEILDEIEDELYDELSEHIDFEKLTQCLQEYLKKLNSKSWLKENAGYSTARENGATVHRFRPDLYVFAKASMAVFEPAIIDPDEYEEMMDDLEYEEDSFDDMEVDLALAIKGSKLTGIALEMEVDGEDLSVEITFSDIGKTVVDVEELEDMLQKAKKG